MTWRSRSLPSAHSSVTCTSPVPSVSPGGTASTPVEAATVVALVEVGVDDVDDVGAARGAVSPPLPLCASPTTIRSRTMRAITPTAPAAPAATHGHGIDGQGRVGSFAARSGDD